MSSRAREVLLDILAAFRDMYDTYGGDGWGLSRDGEPAALHKVSNSDMSQTGRLRSFTRGLPTLGISYGLDEKELAV
jgi:hypothetical protein